MNNNNKAKGPGIVKQAWTEGDTLTKISFFILGAGNLARKQILKGLVFLGTELGFLFYMAMFGLTALSHLGDLGDVAQIKQKNPDTGRLEFITKDNSMLMLLAAVVAIFVIAAFVLAWRANIKAAFEAQKLQEAGKPLPSGLDDIKAHLDLKLHKTLLALPILNILVFNIVPIFFMVLVAFTNFDKNHQPPANLFDWVGLSNFKRMLSAGDTLGGTFWSVLIWTFTWAIFATFLNYILGMLLAIIINRKGTKFKPFWRTIFVISIAIPQFVSLLIVRNMLVEQGPVNILLSGLGLISSPLPFWTNPIWAKVTVIIINLWVGMPYTMLVTTGILQNIPADLYESAKVDGASPAITFFKITLPYMLFVTTPKLISDFVGNLNNFNVIFFLTKGEPLDNKFYQAGHTDLLVTWLYKLTVDSADYNLAAVIGILVFVISATLSLITYRNTGSYKDEEGFQ